MMEDHPRTAVTHNGTYFLTHFRSVAMHPAVGTEGLVFHEGTLIAAAFRIFAKRKALWAHLPFWRMVVFMAVEGDHIADNLFFLFAF